jgi:hypothetical protein
MSAMTHLATHRDSPPRARGRAASSEILPLGGPPQIELSTLSSSDLRVLLANLRRTGRQTMAVAVEAELCAMGAARARQAAAKPVHAPPPPSRVGRMMAEGFLVCGLVGLCVFATTEILPREPSPPEAQPRAMALSSPPVAPAPFAVHEEPGRRLIAQTSPRLAAASPETYSGTVLAQVPRVDYAARVRQDREASAIEPMLPLELAQADPLPDMQPVAAPEPAVSAAHAPDRPLLVSRGGEANLLGSARPRANPLAGLQSGNPVRMATAITAGR